MDNLGYEYQELMELMSLCLWCNDLFRTDLSTATEVESFCCGSHEALYEKVGE